METWVGSGTVDEWFFFVKKVVPVKVVAVRSIQLAEKKIKALNRYSTALVKFISEIF